MGGGSIKQTQDVRTRLRFMVVALPDERADGCAKDLHPIQMERFATAAEATDKMASVLPLAVAVSSDVDPDALRALEDVAQTCATEVVVVHATTSRRELSRALLEAIRRSEARRVTR